MGISVTDISSVVWLGNHCFDLVPAQLAAQFIVLWLVAVVEFVLILVQAPTIVCLLGARYRDFYQLVPIVLQLVFLLSPILYRKDNLGAMAWTANLNPLYRLLSPVRHSLMAGEIQWSAGLLLLGLNLLGLWVALHWLNRERPHLPFLI